MPVSAQLMTVEEFCQLPESEAFVAELRNGEVFQLTRPVKRHDARATRIRQGMQPFADKLGFLREKFTFRPLPEYEVRVADLGFVSWDRWDQVPEDAHLLGSPEFIVEVASPSNSAEELQEKKHLCLSSGCLEFWIVYPKLKQIEVATAIATRTYHQEDTILFSVFPGQSMQVAYVFAPWR